MKDRFNFRVWNGEGLSDVFEMWQLKNCEAGDLITPEAYSVWDDEACVIEQCTGLKDMSGKLAFDGDVIENKVYGGRAVIRWGVPGESYCGWCIEWVPENMNKGQMKHDLLYYSNFENCEIIGNIHENPELLEAQP